MRFLINPVKAGLSIFAVVIFTLLSILAILAQRWIIAAVYIILVIAYAYLACRFCTTCVVDESGVRQTFLGNSSHILHWQDIQEVGIANMKVLRNYNKDRIGELYIYFSPRKLVDDERLGMCLHWPPEDMCFMRFSVRRMKEVQKYWKPKFAFAWLKEEVFLDKYFNR
jgi:hypothetical protein